MNINQTSAAAAIKWQDFSIGAGERVDIRQPGAGSVLVNRVLGSNPSEIFGQLNANGQVFLLNPHGILFGAGSSVNVGGLVASTLDLTEGTSTFQGTGGSVVNRGSLTAAPGGYLALLGSTVSNQGSLTAPGGTVALGAGTRVTLDFSGDQLLTFTVDANAVAALAENQGRIQADGGSVRLSAGAKDSLVASVVNNTGIIEAQTLDHHNGTIILLGGMAAGTTYVDGTLDASAPAGGAGGFIETSAAHVRVADSARLTTLAAGGASGTWLIDPQDFTIAASGGDMTGAALATSLASGNVTVQSTAGATAGSGDLFVNDTVAWSANTTLTLEAARNIEFNAPLAASGDNAGLVLSYGAGADYHLNGRAITLSGAAPTLQIGETGSLVTYTVINRLGTDDSTTGTDLQGIAGNLAGRYALGSDIDASATSVDTWSDGAGFTPLGKATALFTGTFAGLGHTISDLVVDRPASTYNGLFGVTAAGAMIRDIGMIGGSIATTGYSGGLVGRNYGTISHAYATGPVVGSFEALGGLVGQNFGTISHSHATGSVSGYYHVGGLVGYNVSGTIDHSYATGTVTGSVGGGEAAVGGLVGTSRFGTLSHVYATGAVSGLNAVGGLVGRDEGGASTITQAYATGSVTGNFQVGGLFGSLGGGTISQSYATGAVSGTSSVGGLVGALSGAVTASYWDVDTTGQAAGFGVSDGTGTPIGLTTAQSFVQSNYAGLDFTNDWFMVDGSTRPIPRAAYSTTITSAVQLQLIAMDPTAHYTLANDIDASATTTGGAAGLWTTAGFYPLGGDAYGPGFTGSFDGNGHSITGLVINRPSTDGVGLFGYAASGATISHVSLKGGGVTGRDYTGGLVGFNNGTIGQSYVTSPLSGRDSVGGLVGYSDGAISQSYATATVSGANNVGGLVGTNSNGTISQTYATGAVTGSNQYTGGLVGLNEGTVSDAYATGTVSGSGQYTGGLAGYNASGTISRTYATGAVTGTTAVGGLVGHITNGGSVTASYWNTATTGRADGFGTNSGTFTATGLTTAAFRNTASFMALAAAAGWNFTTTWAPPDAGSYPALYALSRVIYAQANDASRFYGDANPTFTATIVGGGPSAYVFGQAGDTLTSTFTFARGSPPATAGVGDYSVAGPTGSRTSSNGAVFAIVSSPGTLTIAPRPLTLSASKTYDGTTDLTGAVTFGNLANSETLTFSGATASDANVATAGKYVTALTLANGTGTAANYVLPTLNVANAPVTIAGRPITVTADGKSRDYGDANPAFTHAITVGSLIGSDILAGAPTTTADTTSNAGTYAITQGTLAAGTNYDLTFTSGTLTVDPRPITVTANAASRTYGDANPAFTYAVTAGSLIGSDALTGAPTTTAGFASNVGDYAITQGTVANANYGITFTAGTLTIDPRTLTLSATKTYDSTTDLTGAVTFGNLVNSETLTYTGATASGANVATAGKYVTALTLANGTGVAANYALPTLNVANAPVTINGRPITVTADDKVRNYGDANPAFTFTITTGSLAGSDAVSGALATAATAASNVGSYAITQGTVTAGGNYNLTFAPGALTVTALGLNVIADRQTRVYGDANPVLTYTLGGGVVDGDTFTGSLATAADTTSSVGGYAITQGTLANANYTFTFVPSTLDVTARPITVTAADLARSYGAANAALTYAVTTGNLVNGDTLAGVLATTATAASSVGTYAITQGTIAAGGNYSLRFAPGALRVTALGLNVIADRQTRVYGDANPALTYTLGSGVLAGDTFTGGLATTADASSSVGGYAITQGTLANANYTFNFVPSTLDVTARPITVTAGNQSRVYGDVNSALTYTVTAGRLVNADVLSGALATTATAASNVGGYAITRGTLANSNYAMNFVDGGLSVTPRPITVTADDLERLFGEVNPPLTFVVTAGNLIDGDALSGALITAAGTTSGMGEFAITQGTLGAPNYAVNFIDGTLTVKSLPRDFVSAVSAATRMTDPPGSGSNPNASFQLDPNPNQSLELLLPAELTSL